MLAHTGTRCGLSQPAQLSLRFEQPLCCFGSKRGMVRARVLGSEDTECLLLLNNDWAFFYRAVGAPRRGEREAEVAFE